MFLWQWPNKKNSLIIEHGYSFACALTNSIFDPLDVEIYQYMYIL